MQEEWAAQPINRSNNDMMFNVPWNWRDVAKALLLIIFGLVLLSAGAGGWMIASGTSPDETMGLTATPLFLAGIGVYLIVILAVYLFAARRTTTISTTNVITDANVVSNGGWAYLGWRSFTPGWIWAIPLLTFVQLMGMAVVNMIFVLPFVGGDFENPQIEAITGGGTLSVTDLVLLMILIAVVAPLAEELFFRGMLYPLMRLRWSAVPAIVVNGLIFSLVHVFPPLLPGLFFVGMVLAWVRERSGSLIPCVLLHAMQNGIVLLGIYAMANGLGG